MNIEFQRIRLRPHEKEDLPVLTAWMQDWEVGRFLDQYVPVSQAEIERRWESAQEAQRGQREFHYGIEDEKGKLIGSVGLIGVDWKNRNAELYVAVGEKGCWGQGYGSEATMALLGFAFGTLNLHRIWLRVFDFNERAIRCCKRCGFQREGRAREALFKDGRYHDALIMSILADEFLAGSNTS